MKVYLWELSLDLRNQLTLRKFIDLNLVGIYNHWQIETCGVKIEGRSSICQFMLASDISKLKIKDVVERTVWAAVKGNQVIIWGMQLVIF